MVHNPNTPNRTGQATQTLTPAMIRQSVDEHGKTIVTIPAGAYECPDPLGTCIEQATGKQLNGGPLNIVGA
jgi:hypothetical protein